MLEIDRLVLRLPPGFEKRAARLGRLTAEALAARPLPASGGSVAQLAVPTQTISPGWSDRRIAHHLAAAIHQQLTGPGGQR